MAVFRKIQIDFWQDAFILDLPFEEKGFYLYLLTNSKTKQCGIYEISHRVIELETGFSQEKIDQMLKKFIDSEKIKYDSETREILIMNWTKHNYSKALTVETCVKKELASVKSKILKSTFDNIYREYIGTIDTLSKEEKEEEHKKKRK